MPDDEFRTDLRWPTDPLGERERRPSDQDASPDAVEPASEVWTSEPLPPALAGADRSLRQMRSTIDDLRSDVNGLRTSVVEWPELERVSSDVAALRADIANIVGAAAAVSLKEVIADLRAAVDSVPTGDSMAEALGELRDEVASLRRRIALRATRDAGVLSDAELFRLADALIERGVIPSDHHPR